MLDIRSASSVISEDADQTFLKKIIGSAEINIITKNTSNF